MAIPKYVKIIIIIASILAVIIGIIFAALPIIRTLLPNENSKDAAASVEKLRGVAAQSENKGDTDSAIKTYEELLAEYRKNNDASKVADAEAKIKQLKDIKIKENEEAQRAATERESQDRNAEN